MFQGLNKNIIINHLIKFHKNKHENGTKQSEIGKIFNSSEKIYRKRPKKLHQMTTKSLTKSVFKEVSKVVAKIVVKKSSSDSSKTGKSPKNNLQVKFYHL